MGKLRKIVPLTDEQRQLFAENIKLPRFVINKYYKLHTRDEDLYSVACEGLMLAAQKWDENEPRLTDSWLYEHTIFELVRLYKSIDWDKHCVLFYGY